MTCLMALSWAIGWRTTASCSSRGDAARLGAGVGSPPPECRQIGAMDFLLAMPDDAGAAAGGSRCLDQRLAEQRMGRLDAVAGGGAVIVDGL